MRCTPMTLALSLAALVALAACSSQKHDANVKVAAVAPSAASQNASGTSSSEAAVDNATGTAAGSVAATLALGNSGMPSFCTYEAPDNGAVSGCFSCTPRSIPIYGCAEVDSGFDPKVSCTSDTHQMQCKTKNPAPFTFNFDTKTVAETVYDELPLLGVLLQGLLGANANSDLGKAAASVLGVLVQNRDVLFKPGDVTPLLTALEADVSKFAPTLGKLDLTTFNPLINKAVSDFRKLVEAKDFTADMGFAAIKNIMALIPTATGGNLAPLFSGFNIASLLSTLAPTATTSPANAALYSKVVNLQQMSLNVRTAP